tara:strand:- start:145 stop:762 length:618 start_codon:yes stop_codon:yes gene_type:complete
MMKYILAPIFALVLLFPSLALGDTVEWGDLVERDGLYYKKFTDVPFTGQTAGEKQGSFKNGVKDGPWVSYWGNGQLWEKGDYKNGLKEGPWVGYHENGGLLQKGNYKDGKQDGPWISYHENGQLEYKGDYKDPASFMQRKGYSTLPGWSLGYRYQFDLDDHEDDKLRLYGKFKQQSGNMIKFGVDIKHRNFDKNGTLFFEQEFKF